MYIDVYITSVRHVSDSQGTKHVFSRARGDVNVTQLIKRGFVDRHLFFRADDPMGTQLSQLSNPPADSRELLIGRSSFYLARQSDISRWLLLWSRTQPIFGFFFLFYSCHTNNIVIIPSV